MVFYLISWMFRRFDMGRGVSIESARKRTIASFAVQAIVEAHNRRAKKVRKSAV